MEHSPSPVGEQTPPAPRGSTTIVDPSRAEQAIARRSAEIRATVPDLELSTTVAASEALRRAQQEDASIAAIAVAAVAGALRRFPRANAAYRDGHYELYSRVNVAIMLEGPDAPTTATLFDADRRPVDELSLELARLRDRARAGELTSREQAGATFTVQDLTAHGIERGVPLVIPGQAAALSVGAVREVPVAVADQIRVAPVMTITLAADHRILFGEGAAGFLAAIAQALEAAE